MQYKNCQFCKIKLDENSDYYYEKTKEDNILCEVCFLKLDFKTKKNYIFVIFLSYVCEFFNLYRKSLPQAQT